MEKLEVFLINLFMWGENFSTYDTTHRVRDSTTIHCEGFKLEFKQLNIKLKQNDFVNQNIITTKITIENISSDQVEQILGIIDDLCWLLSFVQQSPICRHGYKINSNESRTSCLGVIVNPFNNIIENNGKEIRNFIEQVYPTFKKLKSTRQLTVVFGYLCEANRSSLALEISLISHYVAIENLKHTFALNNQYKYSGKYYSHKDYPPLEIPPIDIDNYWGPTKKRKTYIHKQYGQVTSTEMTKRMFDSVGIDKNNKIVKDSLNKRNKMIHEGILLPFNDMNYSKQAIDDLRDVSDLLRQYLLTLLNYQGAYYLSQDRIGPSGLIN
jgi:hypothetical protein